jgi:hypothetical protein
VMYLESIRRLSIDEERTGRCQRLDSFPID